MELKIAFLQILPGNSTDENLIIGKNACIKAKEKGADIALFPEMWSDGYDLPQDEAELRELAIKKDCVSYVVFKALQQNFGWRLASLFLNCMIPNH